MSARGHGRIAQHVLRSWKNCHSPMLSVRKERQKKMIDLSHLPEPVIVLIKSIVERVTKSGSPETVARVAEEAARVAAFDLAMGKAKP